MAGVQMTFPGLDIPLHFDGETYEPKEDRERLTAQFTLVRDLMGNSAWWTIPQLADAIWKAGYKATPQGISARIRDMRKDRFGGHTVDKRKRTKRGDWEYRLLSEAEVSRRNAKMERELADIGEVLG